MKTNSKIWVLKIFMNKLSKKRMKFNKKKEILWQNDVIYIIIKTLYINIHLDNIWITSSIIINKDSLCKYN